MTARPPAQWAVGIAVSAIVLGGAACGARQNAQPICRSDSPTVLMAESVPSASLIPCVEALPGGWTFAAFDADDTGSTFSLQASDLGAAVEVRFVASCDPTGQSKSIDGFPSAQEYRTVLAGGSTVVWTTTFPGGCSRAELTFPEPPARADVETIHDAISFMQRTDVHPP
jgi:hypothetical protein